MAGAKVHKMQWIREWWAEEASRGQNMKGHTCHATETILHPGGSLKTWLHSSHWEIGSLSPHLETCNFFNQYSGNKAKPWNTIWLLPYSLELSLLEAWATM